MIATLLATALFLQSPNTQIKVWQKWIAPGLSYFMEWEPAGPRIVYALKIDLDSGDIRPIAELADGVVYDNSANKGRAPVSDIVKMDHALGGINGDFFPFLGNPLNLMVKDGEFLAMPYQPKDFPGSKRPVFGWGLHNAVFGFPHSTVSVTPDGQKSISVDGFNQVALHNDVTLNTPSAGLAIAKAPNNYAVIQIQSGKWTPQSKLRGSVIATGSDLTSRAVLPGTAILIGEDSLASSVGKLSKGDEVNISIQTTGFDWSNITNTVGGACMLLKNGNDAIDADEARLNSDFVNKRHPRSGVGIDEKGNIWLIAVDGGSSISIGATLPEMAKIMKSFGCINAMNLDGGGSTDLDVLGMTMNQPSDGKERAVANAIVVLGTQPSTDASDFNLNVPAKMVLGTNPRPLEVTRKDGTIVPQAQVFWSGSGAGWVDGGGNVHLIRPGLLTVKAMVNGQIIVTRLQIVGS